MRCTRAWWSHLAPEERSRLVYLKRSDKLSGGYGGGGYLPDDCCECSSCSMPHTGSGLCPACLNELIGLIEKASQEAA